MKKTVFLLILAVLLSLLPACANGVVEETTQTTVRTGWQDVDGERAYYVSGTPLTGWQVIDGITYYFSESGAIYTGWLEYEGARYYLDENGSPLIGWQDIDDKRFYFTESGAAHIGWLELGEERYYLKSDGSMTRGQTEIDGVNHFFTSAGLPILMVNPQNYVPEGYTPDLVNIDNTKLAYTGLQVERSCYDALIEMMTDCNELSGARVYIVSAYRTLARQTRNYNNKVAYWKERGYGEAAAKKKAATSVAIPGTSEHQLGLAVDIVDTRSWTLNGSQASFAGQQWLMTHCWEYGFILRYPEGKSDITGIIYEPWHYRYVGKEVAAELQQSGLTLEEYIAGLS